MLKRFVTIISLIMSNPLYANFDFKYEFIARSYPVGSALNAYLGYNQLLWGDTSSIWYGLIRPKLEGSTSIVVNHYDANISIYPISFLGYGAGHKEMNSNYDLYSFYNCEEVRCKGILKKDYTFGKIALGYGKLITTFRYQYWRNSYDDLNNEGKGVAEYEYIVIANPEFDDDVQRSYFLGYKIGKDLIGFVSDQHQFQRSKSEYKLNIGIYKLNSGNFSYTLGLGSLQSTEQEAGFTAIINIAHTLAPSLTLF